MPLLLESTDAIKTDPYIYTEANPLVAILSETPYVQPATSQFGSISGTNKWACGILHPNGKIYGIPYNNPKVLEIDVVARTMTQRATAGISNGGTFSGAVISEDDKVIFTPCWGTYVAEYDPVTNLVTKFGEGQCGGTQEKFIGSVKALNGKIYCIPHDATFVLEIDPLTKECVQFGNLTGTKKWAGGVLHPNGKIYGIPFDATQVLEIDPINKTTALIGSALAATASKYRGGALAPNGKIYGCSYNDSSYLEIDPINQIVTPFGYIAGTTKHIGGCLAGNGRIYCAPFNIAATEIDPTTKNLKTLTSTGANKWGGAVFHPNGNIYCTPWTATTVLEIQTNATPTDPAMCLHPFFNKV